MSVMVCWVLRFSTLSVTATLTDCPLYLEELHVQVQWNAEWQENHVWHRETLGNVVILHVPCAKGCLDTWITGDVFMNCLIGELRGWVKNLTPEMLLLSCPSACFLFFHEKSESMHVSLTVCSVLQHYPLYRVSDAGCTGQDAAPPEERHLLFREKYDVLSKEASQRVSTLQSHHTASAVCLFFFFPFLSKRRSVLKCFHPIKTANNSPPSEIVSYRNSRRWWWWWWWWNWWCKGAATSLWSGYGFLSSAAAVV